MVYPVISLDAATARSMTKKGVLLAAATTRSMTKKEAVIPHVVAESIVCLATGQFNGKAFGLQQGFERVALAALYFNDASFNAATGTAALLQFFGQCF